MTWSPSATCSRDRTETYSYEVANDTFLTPLLLNLTIFSTITSSERSQGEATITVNGKIDVVGHEPVMVDRRFSAANAPMMAAGAVAVPVNALLTSGFENVQLGGITLHLRAHRAG